MLFHPGATRAGGLGTLNQIHRLLRCATVPQSIKLYQEASRCGDCFCFCPCGDADSIARSDRGQVTTHNSASLGPRTALLQASSLQTRGETYQCKVQYQSARDKHTPDEGAEASKRARRHRTRRRLGGPHCTVPRQLI